MVRGLAFSRDGGLLAVRYNLSAKAALVRLDALATRAATAIVRHGRISPVMSMLFHPERPVLITVGGIKGALLWDVSDPRKPAKISDLFGPRFNRPAIWDQRGAWGSALIGNMLAIGCTDLAPTLLDISDVREPRYPPGVSSSRVDGPTGQRVYALAFHPSGTHLAAMSDDGALTVWDTADVGLPRKAATPDAHFGDPQHAQYSPDGTLLATSALDSRWLLWDTANPAEPRVIFEDTGLGSPLATFSPAGPVLVTTGARSTLAQLKRPEIAVWDISTPSKPTTITVMSPQSPPTAVAFSPDGQRLAVGHFDGSAELWRI